jgi:septal ring factor EnvC (AmiA/AmiB activator)
MLTLGEAAKVSTVTKSAISKAIKSGRMSAVKDDKGYYQIDPAELFRVFPTNTGNSQATVESVQMETRKETSSLQTTVEHLRELLGEIKSERDDLRQRLDKSEDERRATQSKLTALLTHQPNPEAQPAPIPPETKPTANQDDRPAIVRPWLWIALALAVALGIGAYLYFQQQ